MVKRRIEWFEAKATLECVICGKDIKDTILLLSAEF